MEIKCIKYRIGIDLWVGFLLLQTWILIDLFPTLQKASCSSRTCSRGGKVLPVVWRRAETTGPELLHTARLLVSMIHATFYSSEWERKLPWCTSTFIIYYVLILTRWAIDLMAGGWSGRWLTANSSGTVLQCVIIHVSLSSSLNLV